MGLLDGFLGADGGAGLLGVPLPPGFDKDAYSRARLSQGLLAAGLGILANNGPGATFGQAVGRGALYGINSMDRRDQELMRALGTRATLQHYGDQHDQYASQKAAREAYAQQFGVPYAGKGSAALSGAASNIPDAGAPLGMGGGEPMPSAAAAATSSSGIPSSVGTSAAAPPGVPQGPTGRLMSRADMLKRAQFMVANGIPGGDALLRQSLDAPAGYFATSGGIQYEPGGPHDPRAIGQESAAREMGTRSVSGPMTRKVDRNGVEVTEEFAPGQGWRTVGQSPQYDPNSFHAVVGPILQKVAEKGAASLTPSEREAYDMYARTSPMDRIMRGAFGGDAPPAPSAAPSVPPPAPAPAPVPGKSAGKLSETDAFSQARAALAAGADRMRVQQRLKDMGFDPSKL